MTIRFCLLALPLILILILTACVKDSEITSPPQTVTFAGARRHPAKITPRFKQRGRPTAPDRWRAALFRQSQYCINSAQTHCFTTL